MKRRKVPWGTFWTGGLVAVALGLPLVSVAVMALARRGGIGNDEASFDEIATFAAIFAGVPAFFSGGGVARLVAHRLAERGPTVRRALAIGAGAMAVAGAAMALLTAIPLGHLPTTPVGFLPFLGAGLVAGATVGLAIGALVGLRQRRRLSIPDALPEAPSAKAEATRAPKKTESELERKAKKTARAKADEAKKPKAADEKPAKARAPEASDSPA